jgi:DNA-binding MarR family transcriptional regulator
MGLAKELGLPNPIDLENHETVMSVMVTAALFSKEGDRLLKRFGLTDSQFNVLMLLKYQSQGGALDQTTLGRMLVVNRSNVTGLVDRMEQAGWVSREAGADDRRVKLVRLTSEGRRVLASAYKAYAARLKEVAVGLSARETESLLRTLQKLRHGLRASRESD